MNVAGAVTNYISAFPPEPAATFELLRKLDHAFSSLLNGKDSITGEILPGFGVGRSGMSRTDMIRLKSLVEETRVLAVDVIGGDHDRPEESEAEANDDEEDSMDIDEDGQAIAARQESTWDEDEDGTGMNIARVYARTLVDLGKLLPDAFDVTK